MKKNFAFATAFLISVFSAFAQTDPTLFSVNGVPVGVSEFKYIYSKTNGEKADFSRSSLTEYIDLYSKFKMKVARARDMKLDTIPSLKEELAGYRKQLADSYLTDREVSEKLVRELYDRMTKDVSLNHILIKIENGNESAAVTRANAIFARLNAGEKFETVAKEASDDANTKANGGFIGFLSAMLPNGFYDLETAMYSTPIGKISKPTKSPLGIHILRVNETRAARGEIEAAHILIRKKKEGVEQPDARARIEKLYAELKAGGNFEALAQKNSEDSYSATKGGYLGYFGIGRYELNFENGAFELQKDGDISDIIETTIGYHIVKRISRKQIETFEQSKNKLKARVQGDGRFELAKKSLVEKIKRESGYTEGSALSGFMARIDSSFLTYSWQATDFADGAVAEFANGTSKTVSEFVDFLGANANKRAAYATSMNNNPKKVATQLFEDFINEYCLAYEETQLDKKYLDFRNLMREYEEGILLFEAIKINVWDKAAQDTVGLDKFFATQKGKYNWDERAELTYYSIVDSAKFTIDVVKKYAEKHTPQQVLKKFNKTGEWITFKTETVEKDKNKMVKNAGIWKAKTIIHDKTMPLSFVKIEKILPKAPKTLKEARGYVIADYQEHLDKKWLEDLQKSYKLDVNQAVFDSLVK